jgi:hypothetical protein
MVESEDELCGPLSALFQAVTHHLPTVHHLLLQLLFTESLCRVQLLASPPCSRAEACQLSAFEGFFTESSHGDQLLAHPHFPHALRAPHPVFCVCFSVPYYSVFVFVFFWGGMGYAGLSQGWLWEYHIPLICSPVGLRLSSRFGASIWHHGSPPVFFSVTWCGEALYGMGVQGIRVLLLLGGFFLPSVGSRVSATFLICRAHAVCFRPLVTILDLSTLSL